MTALAVVAVLGLIGAPAITRFIQSSQLTTATNDLVADFNLARSEAVKRSGKVGVCKSNDQTTCATSGTWQDGWLVFWDKNNDGDWSTADETVRVHESLPQGINVTAVADLLIFDNQGLTSTGSGDYSLCNPKTGKSRVLNLSVTGRIGLTQTTC